MISRRISRALVAAPLALALGLAACGSGDDSTDDTTTGGGAAGFPVTISHAFGETTIDDTPTRVVAWGWGSADAAIALGVVPVAIPFQSYGGDANGVLPWIAEKLDETGAEVPTVLPDAQEPPFDEIAAAAPDLILAVYSGIDQEQYDLLNKIAPTVAYPDEAWATPWRDLITTVGTALGTDESTFYFTMSYEQLDQLTSDVLVSFATTQQEQDAFLSSQAAQTMPQIRSGAVASLVGAEFIASVSPPTALSVTWGLDDYVAALAAAADKVDAAS